MSLHLGGNQLPFGGENWCSSKPPTALGSLQSAGSLQPRGQMRLSPVKPGLHSRASPTKPGTLSRQRKALRDLSNQSSLKKGASWGSLDSPKRPCLGGQTSAPRRANSFTVFDESMDCSTDPLPRETTSQLGALAPLAANAGQLFGNTCAAPVRAAPSYQHAAADAAHLLSDPPPVQDFLFPIDEQEQYERAMSLDDLEGFGTPVELAASLFKGMQQECSSVGALSQMPSGPWDVLREESPEELAAVGMWPDPGTPRNLGDSLLSGSFEFSPLELPDLPSIDMDMGCDDELQCSQQPSTERCLLF